MRTGISIKITRPDRRRLDAITNDRNASQKHVWRAAIVLLNADNVGTNEIMRQTGASKTCVWPWQRRFMPWLWTRHAALISGPKRGKPF